MRRFRVIPILLLQNGGLYKTIRFSNARYIGDPVNAVKIFNDKEVDELIVLDIGASRNQKPPQFEKLKELAGEAFMPMGYGGGITSVDEIKRIIFSGYEKVILNSALLTNKRILTEGASLLGSQSIVVSVDYRKNLFGKAKVYVTAGQKNTGVSPIDFAREMEDLGAGELILHSIDRDGTYSSYDIEMINKVSHSVSIPIVVCGGASAITDFAPAVHAGASAVAAGSLFVYHGNTRGILLNYPSQKELYTLLFSHF
ncbi:MAG: imidazole glycerol phosphate synthase subunit HisF [Bacteroidetes bacterium]|nr:imidazole glycerol phosphate synthase subunit HisF [Bacteroidota bacterium]